jgi:hypothetical protein
MTRKRGQPDDSERWKPKGLRDHLTINEVAKKVGRDTSRIRQLEKGGKIPAPIRVRVGRLRVRLYSEQEAAKIAEHFKNAKTGRPAQNANPISKRKAVQ